MTVRCSVYQVSYSPTHFVDQSVGLCELVFLSCVRIRQLVSEFLDFDGIGHLRTNFPQLLMRAHQNVSAQVAVILAKYKINFLARGWAKEFITDII